MVGSMLSSIEMNKARIDGYLTEKLLPDICPGVSFTWDLSDVKFDRSVLSNVVSFVSTHRQMFIQRGCESLGIIHTNQNLNAPDNLNGLTIQSNAFGNNQARVEIFVSYNGTESNSISIVAVNLVAGAFAITVPQTSGSVAFDALWEELKTADWEALNAIDEVIEEQAHAGADVMRTLKEIRAKMEQVLQQPGQMNPLA